MRAIWYLENINLFNKLCPHKFKDYASCHTFLSLKNKEYVYVEHQNDPRIYLIKSGKVKICSYAENGDEIVKSVLGKGQVFGLKSVLGECNRQEYAQVLESETSICPIDVGTLQGLMRDNQNFTSSIYKLINFRLRKLERHLEILMFKDIDERVIEFLKDLTKEYGETLGNGQTYIKHPYTQKDMASLLAISRTKLNLVFNDLKKRNLLDFNRNEIFLPENQDVLTD